MTSSVTSLSAGDPPETQETLDRLMDSGHSKDEALELIACVVVSEIYEVLSQGRPYDNDRYVTALRALPSMPWDESSDNKGA
ncbi:MAG: hypothetical protein KAY37_10710 [Phycisphaerae bacterium]|nr:hypothetical protein [Phycisphaerae bacterium]